MFRVFKMFQQCMNVLHTQFWYFSSSQDSEVRRKYESR